MTKTMEKYGEEACNGINKFLEDNEDIEFDYRVNEGEQSHEVIFYAVGRDDERNSDYTYTITDENKTLTFTFTGSEVIVKTDTKDWSSFNVDEHAGEVVGCIIDSINTEETN